MTRLAIERRVMPGGVVVLVNENRATPAVVMRAMMKVGAVFDPPEKAGLARLAGSMLQRGTESRSFEQLNELTDTHGLAISADVGRHSTDVYVKCLTEDLALGVDLLADVLRRPTFPATELERLRGEVMTHLREADNNTHSVAERVFRELAYPAGHPYARRVMGYEETVPVVGAEDLAAHHRRHFRPDALVVAVAGDVGAADVDERLARAFDGWRGEGVPASTDVADVPRPSGVPRRDVVVPGKSQSDIVLGLPAVRRSNSDYYPLEMMNMVLGRLGLNGRLGENVRERRGLAYHASSDLDAGLGPGPWAARAGVAPANVATAIGAIVHEIERIRREPVEEAELADSQSYLTGILPLALETNDGVARTMLSIELYGLGLDYIERYPSIIRSITREQVLEAARRHLSATDYALAVAGPPAV